MKLRARLPHNRTYEQILNHYTVEKGIAARLKSASKEERKEIYTTMYKELFQKVPDHPRLITREDKKNRHLSFLKTYNILKRFVHIKSILIEFAPGDCEFAYFLCQYVTKVFAVDISDQRGSHHPMPANFNLVVYNGYDLDIPHDYADVVFSDHFIEHLHSEDVELHFSLVNKVLKKGGVYIFRTPHAFFGPWDVSLYFSDKAEGFHLREWTFTDLERIVKVFNYRKCMGYWRVIENYVKIPILYFKVVELLIGGLPNKLRRIISRLLIPRQIVFISIK